MTIVNERELLRVVVDTNVLASGIVRANPAAAPSLVIDAWRAHLFQLISSDHILRELERTLDRPYFRQRITTDVIRSVIQLIREYGTVIEPTIAVGGVASHAEDDIVIATAVTAAARYLVTGDRQLLQVEQHRSVQIISAHDFLRVLLP